MEKPGSYSHITIFTDETIQSILFRSGLRMTAKHGGGCFFGGRRMLFPGYNFAPFLSFNLMYEAKKLTD